ncbi:hypothetical protein KXW53_005820 [Aspergillus fumigatus]|nr:hypothetical protein KXX47_008320 [Aspergillus fumigatus]KAH1400456.1 hypothetical protein KXX22_004837 [Aspergillus fumigatus]KAH1968447.1 hypothetical protein KXV80_001888 [Aspergillus fumigatus]KAH2240311.1 hypothetical protein KXW14_008916 [Aspergillus fumigatus]KAH2668188.1 hypothetical protein KXV96_005065 [Aspergillus fumigatus]
MRIAEGGWTILWGDLINEFDVIELIVSIPTGTVGIWVSQQVADQLRKFQQSLKDVSEDVVQEATKYLKELLDKKRAGEWDFEGLGVKAGIATYRRWDYLFGNKFSLPNNHQPYIGLRVRKPLPPKEFTFQSSAKRPTKPGKNLGAQLELVDQMMYEGDFLQSKNGVYRFICQGNGNAVLYGPDNEVVWNSRTVGMGHPPYAIMARTDRNVVLYDEKGSHLWETDTRETGHPNCVLILQDDRNLVLYDPDSDLKVVWETKTAV